MRRFFWFVVVILVGVFLLSFLGSLQLMWGGDSGPDLSSSNVGVIEIEGVIETSLPVLEQIREFRDNDNLKALIVRIDSPGGAVGASQEIFLELKRLRDQDKVPVVISMGNVAASGGFYISIGGSWVIALPGTITGSMGVVLPLVNFSKLVKKVYLEPVTIKSGALKDAGNPMKPRNPEHEKFLQAMVEKTFAKFRLDVQTERKLSDEAIQTLSDARVVDGEEAMSLGVVDALGTFEDAVAHAKEKAGLGEAKLAFLSRQPKSLIEKLFEGASARILARLEQSLSSPAPIMAYESFQQGW